MSQENVKIVRSYFELVGRLLDEYWAKPEVPLSESPVLDQGAFDLVHPDAEWKTPVMREAVRGRDQWLRAIDDGLEAVDYWRPEVEDVLDAGEDEVVAVVVVSIRGKGSGVAVARPSKPPGCGSSGGELP